MPITALGAGSAATPVASGDLTVSYPGSLVEWDLLVLYAYSQDNVVLSLPRDWATRVGLNNVTTRLTVAWKRMNPGDTDTSVLLTHTAGDVIAGRVFGYRNVARLGDPFEASVTRANSSGAGSGTWGSLDFTTANNDTYIIHAIGVGDDSTSAAGSGFTSDSPAGLTSITKRDDWETTTGLDESGAVFDAAKATAGRQTGLAITFSPTAAAVSTEWVGALTPSVIQTVPVGGALAAGSAPVANTVATVAGAAAQGNPAIASVAAPNYGAVASGTLPATAAGTITVGGADARGVAATAQVVSPVGGAVSGTSIPTPTGVAPASGAVAGSFAGISPSAILISGGANAGGLPAQGAVILEASGSAAGVFEPISVSIMPTGGAIAAGREFFASIEQDEDRLPSDLVFVQRSTAAALRDGQKLVLIETTGTDASIRGHRTFTVLNYG